MKKLFSPVLFALLLSASISAQTKDISNSGLFKTDGLSAVKLSGKDTPLRKFSFEEAARNAQKDSLALQNKSLETKGPSAGTIIGEILIGPLTGGAVALPMALLFSGASDHNEKNDRYDNLAWGAIGIGVGYVVGTGLGVYLFAHADNPEVTFGGTLLGSILGAGAGIGAAAIINNGSSAVPYVIALSCPLIGSMVYANFIAPRPQSVSYSYSTDNYRSIALSYSHKDLYNSTLKYRMNLFTIAF